MINFVDFNCVFSLASSALIDFNESSAAFIRLMKSVYLLE